MVHRQDSHGPKGQTTVIDRTRGADGVVDATVTGPKGNTSTIDRSRGADGAVDSTRTRADGSTTTVNRTRGADGLTDKTVLARKGGVSTVDRTRGADGAVDSVTTGPKGGTTTVDRSRQCRRHGQSHGDEDAAREIVSPGSKIEREHRALFLPAVTPEIRFTKLARCTFVSSAPASSA